MGGGGDTASSRHSAHAAQGKMRMRKGFVEKPDTIVQLPDGRTMTLRRSEADVVPIFRKFDPKHYDSRTGKPIQKGKRGGDGSPPKPIPGLSFSRLLISAFLMHRAYTFLRDRFRPRQTRPSDGRLQLPAWDEVTEEDLDDEHRTKLAAARKAQAAMTQAMLRNAMPKPKRQGLPQKAKQAHQSRPKTFVSARDKMHPPNAAKPRAKGMLQRIDNAVQRSVREEVAAVRQSPASQALPAASSTTSAATKP